LEDPESPFFLSDILSRPSLSPLLSAKDFPAFLGFATSGFSRITTGMWCLFPSTELCYCSLYLLIMMLVSFPCLVVKGFSRWFAFRTFPRTAFFSSFSLPHDALSVALTFFLTLRSQDLCSSATLLFLCRVAFCRTSVGLTAPFCWLSRGRWQGFFARDGWRPLVGLRLTPPLFFSFLLIPDLPVRLIDLMFPSSCPQAP